MLGVERTPVYFHGAVGHYSQNFGVHSLHHMKITEEYLLFWEYTMVRSAQYEVAI